jgi:hypothetical protein
MRWVGCIRNIRYLRWTDLAGGHSVPVGADDQREAAMRFVGCTRMVCISVIWSVADIGSALTAGHFSFGKSNQNHLLPVWPSFVGFPHAGNAPWARAERASMP